MNAFSAIDFELTKTLVTRVLNNDLIKGAAIWLIGFSTDELDSDRIVIV